MSDSDPVVRSYADDDLNSLIEFAKSVDLEELIWEKEGRRIAFKRRVNGALPETVPAAAPAAASAAPNGKAKSGPASRPLLSPMVGTFWRALSKDRPPLVVEGGAVTVGQRVAYVEAMKVNKDVISDANGRIVKIYVENGKPVEYGQKLFEVEVS